MDFLLTIQDDTMWVPGCAALLGDSCRAPRKACAHANIHVLLTREYLSRNLGNVKAGPAIIPILLDGDPICHHPEVKYQAFCADEPVLVVYCDHVPWLPSWLGQLEGHRSLHACHADLSKVNVASSPLIMLLKEEHKDVNFLQKQPNSEQKFV